MSPDSLPTDPSFAELTRRVTGGQCAAFVGAGLSMDVYPGWDSLTSQLCDRCGVTIRHNAEGKALSNTVLAQMAKRADAAIYNKSLRDIFRHEEPSHRHHLLARIPFRYYLTTNYDYRLASAIQVTGGGEPGLHWYPDLLVLGLTPRDIVCLHGKIDPASSADPRIVLAQDDYDAAYDSSSPSTSLWTFLAQLLPMTSICFIGCSLDDQSLQGVFRVCAAHCDRIRSAGHPLQSRWYVLLDQNAELTDGWETCGVTIVRYEKQDDRHKGLVGILDHWAGTKALRQRELRGDGQVDFSAGAEVPK